MSMRPEEMEKCIRMLMFQVELLFENSEIDRYVFESRLTREQFTDIMNLMDELRCKLDAGNTINVHEYEEAVYSIVPEKHGQYHFCETIARLFAEDGRWEEVFPALYGSLPKYSSWSKNKNC